ncbi:hypothetical protein HF086_011571, partial [Spodoptera exigua]
MSSVPKRTVRKLSRSKSKHFEVESYTSQHLPVLRRKRTIALNRLLKALEVGNLARSDDAHTDLFLSYCEQLDKWTSEFEHAHWSIIGVLESSDQEGDDDDETQTRFDDIYFQIMSIRRQLNKSILNSSEISHQADASSSSLVRVRLPKIQLPAFSGNIKHWPEFIDTFNALIHDSPSLRDVEKFHYLVSSLSGDPLSLIRTFPITGDHYSDAYAALVARYQDKRDLAYTCWRDVLNVNFKLQSATDFRATLDSIDENLSILKRLKLPIQHWDFTLVYHLLSKLDSKIRREFEEKCGHTEFHTFTELKQFLHSKCEALIRDNHFSDASKSPQASTNKSAKRPSSSYTLLADSSVTSNKINFPSNKQTNPESSNQNNSQNNKSFKCSFCSSNHSITKCKTFLDKTAEERMSVAVEKKWCFNCLKSSHQIKDCKSVFRCMKCKHKHHTLLHTDRGVANKIQSGGTESDSVALLAKDSNSTLVSKSSSNCTVLLATAIVQIQDSNGQLHSFRALFDTGSQNNFITKNAAQCLNLKPTSCETNINGLGGIAASIIGLVNCSIASKNQRLFNVDLHVISNICGDQPIARLNTVGWSHIHSLPLADPGFDVPGPIDILLGADVFADSLLNQRIKGAVNQPVAFNSVFGWLLLGRTSLVTSSLLQFSSKPDNELCTLVQRFWEIDSIPKASSLTPDEIACEQIYSSEYGRDSSGRTIQQLAEDEGTNFPLAQQILRSDIYVDDVVTGFATLDLALEAKSQIINLFKRGHFQLRKWASNEPQLLSDLPPEECLLDPKSFSDEQPSTIKVLGLKWDPASDAFLFDVRSSNRSCTKRNILSEIARVFDPLGFLSPLTIKAKVLLQKLWLLGVSWDESPPEDIACVWKAFCDQLSIIQDLKVPRCLTARRVQAYELHGFCDSSELAYGAVLYMRILFTDDTIQVLPLCAKARVAPINKLSLPRLELCAAVVLADLVKFVLDTYNNKMSINSTHLWSDSTVVLSWLRSHSSRWNTFVANRVSAIQDVVPVESWHHVASADNPADVCSRGQLPHDLLQNTLWWSGPSWLSQTFNHWPNNSKFPILNDAEESEVRIEERRSVVLVTEPVLSNPQTPIDYLLKRYSSLDKIIRIISYMRRFLLNPNNRNVGEFTTEIENYKSLLSIVKFVQSTSFADDIQQLQSNQPLPKPLRKLNPFLDEEGILRVGGRISRAGIEYDQRHPALLPCDHPFTFKLIESIHRRHCHTGYNTTHYLILQRFWVLSAKRAIRK